MTAEAAAAGVDSATPYSWGDVGSCALDTYCYGVYIQ